jgi:iron complex outermembrane recepter protein
VDTVSDQHMKKLITSGIAALAAAAPAQSQTATTEDTAQLPEVVVTATRLPDATIPAADYAGNVSIVTRTEIEAAPAFNLQDLLGQEVGFTPLETVGFGTQTAPFGMRGFGEKAGTLVLVDGVRMNDAGDGFFLWNSVPIENIDRVEIIRGGASTIYGEGAAAGVINIITKEASRKPLASSFSFSGGNHGYYDGHIELSGTQKGISYRFNADREEWAGWRDGANFRSWNLGARFAKTLPVGKLSLSYSFHTQYSENPSTLTTAQFLANPRQVGATQFTFENDVHRVNLGYRKAIESGWNLGANFHAQSYDTTSTGFGLVSTEQPSIGFVAQASREDEIFARENNFTLGGEVRRQDFAQSGFGLTVHDDFNYGIFLENRHHILDQTRITAGARYDIRDSSLVLPFPAFTGEKENDEWSYKFSLDHDLSAKTKAWISWSLAYRLPSANDVISSDPTFPGNPALVPVQSRTFEAGIRTRPSRLLDGSLTYYYSQVEDDIYSEPGAPSFGGANNADVLRQGIELSLKSRPTKKLSLHFNAAFADAQFDGGTRDGNRLTMVPEWQLSSGISLRPNANWTLALNNVYVGGQVRFFDVGNTLSQNVYNVMNAKLSYRWNRFETYVSVNNLLDRVYEQFPTSNPFVAPFAPRHNPAPGINFRAGLNARF